MEDALCRKESEMLAALGRVDALKLRLQEVEENSQIAEEDLKSLARRRESEIESLARRNEVLSDALSRLTSADTDPEATAAANIPTVYTTLGTGGSTGFPAIPRLEGRRGVALSLGADSWQSASASSLSSATGEGVGTSLTGLEASLNSVLGDSGTGFEPPAPPIIDHHHHQPHHHLNHHHNQQNSQSIGKITERLPADSRYSGGSSGVGRGSIGLHNGQMEGAASVSDNWLGAGGGGGRGVADNRKGASSISSAEDDATRYRPARDRRTALGGGERVLHGVSAAMASGALPTTTHPQNTTTTTTTTTTASSRDIGAHRELSSSDKFETQQSLLRAQQGGDAGGGGLVRNDGRKGGEGGGYTDERSNGDASAAEGIGLALGGDGGDGREQARRQIDQALRDRALRRRTSDDEVVTRPDRRDSSSQRPRPSKDSTAAAVHLAFPTLSRSDFRTGSSGSLGGGEEATRFINLDAMKHRASAGSKQGLPGREGTKVARARSAATGATNGFAIAGAGNNVAARVYGIPQNSR
ncbi:unnamed protein product [Laminaria digitata]